MSWENYIDECDREFMIIKNYYKKGNDSMNLQNMTIEELKAMQGKINQEMKIREEKVISETVDDFLKIWRKMESLGFSIRTEDIGSYSDSEELRSVQMEINGKEISIYE